MVPNGLTDDVREQTLAERETTPASSARQRKAARLHEVVAQAELRYLGIELDDAIEIAEKIDI